jgi:hypothetical protein
MVLLSNGNVGIGTTSPGNKLQINARSTNYYQTSMSSNAASIFGTSTNASDLDLGSHGAILGLYNNNAFAVGRGGSLALGGRSYDFGGGEVIMTFGRISGVQRPDHSAFYGHLVFETHNSGGMYERMRIDHSGNVGIGTTAPADILQVRAAANKSLLVSSTANTANAVRLGAVNDANSAYVPLEIDASMTNFLGGNVGIGTTLPGYLLHVNGSVAGVGAYNQLSDERFKKDITDIQNSLEKVLAIHGVTYKWIDEERYGSETQIGVIAQEIEKVVPEVVTTGSDGVKRVRYSDLVPLLIEAFKHEHTISQQLKAESEQLKAAFCLKFPEMPFCSR